MTDEQIKHMVDRFLGWRLPENFTPDAGISFERTFNDHLPVPMKHEPVGTNLFDASQATEMVRYMVEGLPAPDKPEAEAVLGSSVCPICGKDSPHYHAPDVVAKHYSRAKAISDQHLLCVRLADALRGMPFPPHMPDEAGNAMRGALDEFDEKSAAYLQAALSAPLPSDKLRGLVRKWRKELREVDSDRDNYSPPSADYFADQLEEALLSQEPSSGAGMKDSGL